MAVAVDFHSHILPGIDDGCDCVDEAIALLQMESDQGVRHVVLTPHFYANHDNLERYLTRRENAERLLREEMKKYTGLPTLHLGAEVHFFTGMSESEQIADLAISSTKHILIEMPHPPWTEKMYRELERIYTKRGLTPIIAHVDRYISRFRTFQIPQRLEKLPVKIQANAEFFLSKNSSSMAMRMLRDGQIHLLGSDCHNATTRKPNVGDAVKWIENRSGKAAIAPILEYEQTVLFGNESILPTRMCE